MDALLEALIAGAGALVEPILAYLGQVFAELLIRIIAIPVFCVALTPVVLVYACFGPGRYLDKVWSTYAEFVIGLFTDGLWM